MQAAIRIDCNLFQIARREHGVEMRGERDVGSLPILYWMGDNVACAIDPRYRSNGFELRENPFSALLFEKSWGRDTA